MTSLVCLRSLFTNVVRHCVSLPCNHPLMKIKGLLHGYEWGLRFGGLELRFGYKTRVSVANEFVFCQNLNESPSNLNLHELP